MGYNEAVGRYGEAVAERALTEAGFQILARNWRCAQGEIDLIARDGEAVVFCEVKTRRSAAYGDPAEAVSPTKAARLRRLAAVWLGEQCGFWPVVRFDVVSVLRPASGPASCTHLRGAF